LAHHRAAYRFLGHFLRPNSMSWRMASERDGWSGCSAAHFMIIPCISVDSRTGITGSRLSSPVAGRWVFCFSLADVFDNEVGDDWRAEFFGIARRCKNLRIQIVTKRIGNALKMLPPTGRATSITSASSGGRARYAEARRS
jgi:protein gp37